jgi:hypothetical protein
MPKAFIVVPISASNCMREFHILSQVVLVNDVVEITPNLRRTRVVVGPIRVVFPSELIAC